MSEPIKNDDRYHVMQVDNAVCRRRFHLCYEVGPFSPTVKHVEVKCPHCQATVFEAENHQEMVLSREENLVQSPDGSRPLMPECRFFNKNV